MNAEPISTINSSDAIAALSGILEINVAGDSTYIEWVDPDRFFGEITLSKAGKAQKLVFTKNKIAMDKEKRQREKD